MKQADSSLSEHAFDESGRTHSTESTERRLLTDVCPITSPAEAPSVPADAPDMKKECCICGSALTEYTCPGCNRRTCSLHCVKEHKCHYNCSGMPSVSMHLDLSKYSGLQMQRDYHFLEDCKRIIDNAARFFSIPNEPHYKFHTLPPNLRTLREEAGKRGVICQIMSEGMRKRDENTSRYDRSNNTITWKCEFIFHPRRVAEAKEASANHGESFTVSTDWASERHKLEDVVQYCWAINPPLPCFHINRKYNKVSGYVGRSTSRDDADPNNRPQPRNAGTPSGLAPTITVDVRDTEEGTGCISPLTTAKTLIEEELLQHSPANASKVSDYVGEKPAEAEPLGPVFPLGSIRLLEQHPGSREEVERFLSVDKWVVLAKAERLGNQEKYFRLNLSDTLNEALRILFFINEYPVFIVVYEADLPYYPLATSEDKEAIRESFRSTGKKGPDAVDCARRIAGGNARMLSHARERQCLRRGAPPPKGGERPRKESVFFRKDSHGHAGKSHKRPRSDNIESSSRKPFYQRKTNRSECLRKDFPSSKNGE